MDHNDGQECVPSGQSSYGDPRQRTQIGGAQAQPALHELRGQGGRDREGAGATTQHKAIAGLDEVMCQGHCHHAPMTCHYADFCPNNSHVPRRGVVQIYNERRPPGYTTRAQGPSNDQVGPGRGPHARPTSTQVEVVAIVQGGQGGKQAHFLVHSRALR